MKPQPERILLFITDQQRADCFSSLGHPLIQTPHFDSLMEEGVTFTRAYTHNPLCVPARANLWTGLPSHISGCVNNRTHIPLGTPCLPEFFTDMEWYTYSAGRLHFKPRRNPHGFQKMDLGEGSPHESDYHHYLEKEMLWKALPVDPENPPVPNFKRADYLRPTIVKADPASNRTTWTVTAAIKEIERSRDVPTFMNIGLLQPHPNFNAPYGFDKLYDPEKVRPPKVFEEDWASRPKSHHTIRHNKRGGVMIQEFADDLENVKANAALYFGDITHIDYELGRLVHYLKREGLFDDTLLICTSDHGEMLGDHRLFLKNVFYEASVRIPMILSWPRGLPPGKRVSDVVTLQDLFTTCMDLLGHERRGDDAYRRYRHANLVEMAHGAVPDDNRVFLQSGGGCKWGACAVDTNYKYAFYVYEDHTFDDLLYDLEEDPEESTNLSERPEERELRDRYRRVILDYMDDPAVDSEEACVFIDVLGSVVRRE